jgi:hypothetical protein
MAVAARPVLDLVYGSVLGGVVQCNSLVPARIGID